MDMAVFDSCLDAVDAALRLKHPGFESALDALDFVRSGKPLVQASLYERELRINRYGRLKVCLIVSTALAF